MCFHLYNSGPLLVSGLCCSVFSWELYQDKKKKKTNKHLSVLTCHSLDIHSCGLLLFPSYLPSLSPCSRPPENISLHLYVCTHVNVLFRVCVYVCVCLSVCACVQYLCAHLNASACVDMCVLTCVRNST